MDSESILGHSFLGVQDRPIASAYTIALGAKMLWPQIRCSGKTFRLLLLGARHEYEGEIDWCLLRNLLRKYTPWDGDCNLEVELLGPEIDSDSEAFSSSSSSEGVTLTHGLYHNQGEDVVKTHHLAVVMNGGIDCFFDSWAPSVIRLRDQGIITLTLILTLTLASALASISSLISLLQGISSLITSLLKP